MTSVDGRIRPLIVLPSDPFGDQIGGIKTFVREFIHFSPDEFETEIVACSSDPIARPVGHWQVLEVAGRRVRYIPVLATPDVHRRPLIPRSLRFTLAAFLERDARRFSGRVLQFHHPGVPAGYLRARAPKILVVHLDAADIDSGQGESRWGKIPGLLHRFEDITLPRIDRIFTVNRSGADFYRARHPNVADRVSFLPTFVDPTMFAPLDGADRARARRGLEARLGVAADPADRLLLFVGRLERQKDPELLIRSFVEAQRRHGRLRLVVVGEGGLRDEATALAASTEVADRVHWLGFQPRSELPDLMNTADMLLLPSLFEGMPITVLEALACGLPVVGTAVGEVPAVVQDGANGRLIAERSPEAVAEGILWVAERPRDGFQEACLAAVAPYTPARVLAPFFEAHRELHRRAWG